MKTYRVEFLEDSTYQVINNITDEFEYQGSLADCEAYIRLKENGYM